MSKASFAALRRRRRDASHCHALEPRLLLATYTVTSTADAGAGSLRQAILNANSNAGADTIAFNLSPAGVVHTISPVTMLPAITGQTTINGNTQPGYTAGRPLIQLSGNLNPAGGNGLMFQNASGSTIRALIINRFTSHGVILSGGTNVVVEGNWIGLDSAGTAAAPNRIGVLSNAGGSRFGGAIPLARNVVSGNTDYGLQLDGNDNVVTGNYVGTNSAGTVAVGNGIGVNFRGSRNRVGGTAAGEGNVISGNTTGVRIGVENAGQPDAVGNLVIRNFIGTGAIGNGRLGNVTGVSLIGGATGTVIGGTTTAAGNLISGNGTGVLISGSPPVSGSAPVPARDNRVEGNVIGLDGNRTRLSNDTGVWISGGSTGNVVGGTAAGTRNTISGNGYGVRISGATTRNNRVQGNYFGLTPDGAGGAVQNSIGVAIQGATSNTVGGIEVGAGNVISNSFSSGISILATATLGPATDNRISGNYIGTDPTGTLDLGNGNGIEIIDAASNTIGGATAAERNVISGNNGAGVTLQGPGNRIFGNYIGTDAAGTAAIRNGTGVAIAGGTVPNSATGNWIGGVNPGEGNVISGNGTGVLVSGVNATGTLVRGNRIGTNAAGNTAVPNSLGVRFTRVGGGSIGGDTTAARNQISGNTGDGIALEHCLNVVVRYNLIGLNAGGTGALGNAVAGVYVSVVNDIEPAGNNLVADNVISGNRYGVYVQDADDNHFQGNTIGLTASRLAAVPNTGTGAGTGIVLAGVSLRNTIGGPDQTPGVGNFIAGNDGDGILIGAFSTGTLVQGNRIGYVPGGFGPPVLIGNRMNGVLIGGSNNRVVDNFIAFNDRKGIAVVGGTNNALLRNTLDNDGLGIDLGDNGVTPNDPGDIDTGANAFQNFPVITTIDSDPAETTVSGTLNSRPNLGYEVQFFSTAAVDPSGHGEGQVFLRSVVVTTNASGNASFEVTLPPVTPGHYVTATATRIANSVPVETSEFSAAVVAPPHVDRAPRVMKVFAGGAIWAPVFTAHLQAAGMGESVVGFAIPAGPAQLAPLPWANVNTISIRFSEQVNVQQNDLVVRAAVGDGTTPTPQYTFLAFTYSPSARTATWTLRHAVRADRLQLDLNADGPDGVKDLTGNALDGEWTDGQSAFPGGDREAGGDFLFRFNVLPGDVNRSGAVNVIDEMQVRRRYGSFSNGPGTPTGPYSVFGDLNADGRINALDVSLVRTRQRRGLP